MLLQAVGEVSSKPDKQPGVKKRVISKEEGIFQISGVLQIPFA